MTDNDTDLEESDFLKNSRIGHSRGSLGPNWHFELPQFRTIPSRAWEETYCQGLFICYEFAPTHRFWVPEQSGFALSADVETK
jgi:hypothetical protein